MRAPRNVVVAAQMFLLLGMSTAWVQAAAPLSPLVVTWERYFTLNSQWTQAGGRPIVHGTIRNDADCGTRRIQLLVEGLDATGAVVSQRIEWLGTALQPGERTYFEFPAGGPVTSYRVSVFAFDLYRSAAPR